jgi:hypothetical protein
MRIAAKAWAARQHCRAALCAGDLAGAFRWAATAQQLQKINPESLSRPV